MNKFYVYYSCFNGDCTWYDFEVLDSQEDLDAFLREIDKSFAYNVIKVIYGKEIES